MRTIGKAKYVAAFSLTVLIFLGGVIAGYAFGQRQVSEIADTQNQLRLSTTGFNLQNNIIEQRLCEIDVFDLTSDRFELGKRVTLLENNLGKKNHDVLTLKEEYTLLSINQWLLVERYKKMCGLNTTTILFFYSNSKNESAAYEQGFILDYIYKTLEDRVIIYSIDVELDNPAIRTMKELYGINTVPSLVIDGKTYTGLQTKERLEGLIST